MRRGSREIRLNSSAMRLRIGKKNKRKNLLISLLHILLFSLLSEIIYLAYTSPYLRVAKVEISGTKVLKEAEILEKVKIPLGTNLFRLDLVAIREALEKNPRIREALVSRTFPDSVAIEIKEREPFAQVQRGGRFLIVDKEGFVFDLSGKSLEELPIIEEVGTGKIVLGKKIESRRFYFALQCLLLMRKYGLPPVLRIKVGSGNKLEVTLRDSLRILYGTPEKLPEKVRFSQLILQTKKINGQKADYLDLRSLEAPVWKEKCKTQT